MEKADHKELANIRHKASSGVPSSRIHDELPKPTTLIADLNDPNTKRFAVAKHVYNATQRFGKKLFSVKDSEVKGYLNHLEKDYVRKVQLKGEAATFLKDLGKLSKNAEKKQIEAQQFLTITMTEQQRQIFRLFSRTLMIGINSITSTGNKYLECTWMFEC